MKRRDFFALGAGSVIAGALPLTPASSASTDAVETFPIGNFLVSRDGNSLRVEHRDAPGRILWETTGDAKGCLVAEVASMTVKDFGTPRGSFDISDSVSETYAEATIGPIHPGQGELTVTGALRSRGGKSIGFTLTFTAASASQLAFMAETDDPSINRITLRLASVPDEAFFGFGMQMTYVDQKGHLLPIIVQEHGVGRGSPIITEIVDVLTDGGGGTPYATEAPVPQFITSRLRSMLLENTEYSTFDMRPAASMDAKVWSRAMNGRIVYGRTPVDILTSYTEYSGRMRKLPDWVHQGVIASVQGGTAKVREKLDALNGAAIPLAGLWIQDWPGVRVTSAGSQLWWDWKLDEEFYPGWQQLVADLKAQGARMLTYVNPFLSHEEGHNSLFKEADAKGYLVLDTDGSPFMNKNTNFTAALIDLSNPEARTWIKQVIRKNMIEGTGASGWMHDFGEALPFEGHIAGGDLATFHNRYPVEWARAAREAIEEAGLGDDILFFDRSGFTNSPACATAFWLGDQLQSWDEYDGIKSAVAGMLSAGMSGYSIVHSDTGGYGALKFAVADHTVPVIARSPELFMRWMELNAFTAIFRTHEGLDPAISAQFDTNDATKAHLKRFAQVYRALAPYRKELVAEAADKGTPVVRHPFLHYHEDPNVLGLRYQFMLGPDVMVAPVLDKGATTVSAYLPAGEKWIDLWTGRDTGIPGEWVTIDAPLGRPGVLLRQEASASGVIRGAFADAGLLE